MHCLRNIIYFTIFYLAGSLLAGCTSKSQPEKTSGRIAVKDFRGEAVYLHQPADQVVCLIESALTGIYMLGQKDKVIGIPGDVYFGETWKRYASLDERIRNKTLPTPGNWDFVSIEEVVGLQPDLVIIWASQTEAIENLERLGIPVYAVMLHSFEDVSKEIEDFGRLLGAEHRAAGLIELTRKELNDIKQHCLNTPKKSVYFMWAQGINETSGRNSTVDQLLEYAGTVNVCNLPDEHVTINIEKLIDWNPDLIVMWYNEKLDPEDILANPLLQGLTAVKNKQIYEFPSTFDCDLWTLKMAYPVRLVATWAYEPSKMNLLLDPAYFQQKLYDLKQIGDE
jgi:iron complex transport system substrate-binding protein